MAGLPLSDESFVTLEAVVLAAFNAAELPELGGGGGCGGGATL